jgi:putative membrane protein
MLRLAIASLHLLALGIGLGAIWTRFRALRGPLDAAGLRRVFAADAVWGLAGGLWIVTGLWRVFGGLEKGTAFYLGNHVFWGKMAMVVGLLALEVAPMMALIHWRLDLRHGQEPDTRMAPTWSWISLAQAVLVVLMTIAAVAMTRGYGYRG